MSAVKRFMLEGQNVEQIKSEHAFHQAISTLSDLDNKQLSLLIEEIEHEIKRRRINNV